MKPVTASLTMRQTTILIVLMALVLLALILAISIHWTPSTTRIAVDWANRSCDDSPAQSCGPNSGGVDWVKFPPES